MDIEKYLNERKLNKQGMMMEYVWMNKKVYIETSSGRKYSGKVVNEDEIKLVLIDWKGHIVEISRDEIKICQEEE